MFAEIRFQAFAWPSEPDQRAGLFGQLLFTVISKYEALQSGQMPSISFTWRSHPSLANLSPSGMYFATNFFVHKEIDLKLTVDHIDPLLISLHCSFQRFLLRTCFHPRHHLSATEFVGPLFNSSFTVRKGSITTTKFVSLSNNILTMFLVGQGPCSLLV